MTAHLRLVSDNPDPWPSVRLDARALHRLADRLTAEIRAGHYEAAHRLVFRQKLSPFGVAIVATWMNKAGLGEGEILDVLL